MFADLLLLVVAIRKGRKKMRQRERGGLLEGRPSSFFATLMTSSSSLRRCRCRLCNISWTSFLPSLAASNERGGEQES
jgi:hypothetical protein